MSDGEQVPTGRPTATGDPAPLNHTNYLALKPARIFRGLLAIIAVLALAGLLVHLLRFRYGLTNPQTFGFIDLFDMDRESSVPTWFSSGLLAACAALLALIAIAKRSRSDPWFWHWAGLGLIFMLLSLDEIAKIHEGLGRILDKNFVLDGLLTHGWVLIAIPLLLVLLFLYISFLRALPPRSAWLFLLSAAVYLCGVVGVEAYSGLIAYIHGSLDVRFALLTSLEETLEMLGLAFFIYSLTDYATRQGFSWHFGSADPQ